MSVAANQQRTFLRLARALQPHWRRDPGLPARIQTLLADRSFGSRDRRLYRELLYTTLRVLPWFEAKLDADPEGAVRLVARRAADLPATAAFRAAWAAGDPEPADERDLLPSWFEAHAPELFSEPELACQLRRAPLWLRVAREANLLGAEFAGLGWTWTPSEYLPGAWRVHGEADVTRTAGWAAGRCEVQDLGSQLLLETIGVERGARWLDACAGAGGKTLQLATLLGAGGTVDASDIRPTALAELATRAARAGYGCREAAGRTCPARAGTDAATIRILSGTPAETYDGVLVDAPCSGSGTWRRAPHLKWTTTPEQVERAAALQLSLLARAAGHVRPGGRLVYATCSLSRRENEEVAVRFLEAHPGFAPVPFARTFHAEPRGPGLLVWPSRHDTDGFYVASFRRQ